MAEEGTVLISNSKLVYLIYFFAEFSPGKFKLIRDADRERIRTSILTVLFNYSIFLFFTAGNSSGVLFRDRGELLPFPKRTKGILNITRVGCLPSRTEVTLRLGTSTNCG